jgi:uncharacterized membrane protein YphA (DoxX/SURF4 family)
METEKFLDSTARSRSMKTAPPWMVWLWRFLRVILGSVFIYASADKIINPEQFAYAISNYKLLPVELVNFVALLIPWLEAVVGIFLIVGLFEWVSLTLYNGMMIMFMIVIVISLARGLNISCGCFSSDPNAEKMTWLTLFRDSLLLLPGLGAYPLLRRLRRPPFFS